MAGMWQCRLYQSLDSKKQTLCKLIRTKNYKIQIISAILRLITTMGFFYAISTVKLAELYSVFFAIPIFVSFLSIFLLKEKYLL